MQTLETALEQNTGRNQLWGLIGNRVIGAHSCAPAMWEILFRERNMSTGYFVLGTDEKEQVSKYLKLIANRDDIAGFNIARPWKGLAFECCDTAEPVADAFETINTVVYKEGKRKGYNTDGTGIVKTIKEQKELENTTALILGAGGAARTVPYHLALEGVSKIYLIDVITGKAEKLVQEYGLHYPGIKADVDVISEHHLQSIASKADIIINATPCGMTGYPREFPIETKLFDFFKRDVLVAEMVYTPVLTPFLLVAQSRGYRTSYGINMLVEQASDSFELAFDQKIRTTEKELMKKTCEEVIR